MEFINVLIDLITDDYKILECEEDFEIFKSRIQINSIFSSQLNYDLLNTNISKYVGEDIIKIYFIQKYNEGGEESIDDYSKDKDISTFIDSVRNEIGEGDFEDGDTYLLEIKIYKNSDSKYKSIYDFEEITRYFLNCSLYTLLYQFNQLICKNKICIFNIKESKQIYINTKSIYFISDISSLEFETNINIEAINESRYEYIKSRITICNFKKESEFALIPEDFNLVRTCTNQNLNLIFNKIKIMLSIISICDISDISKDKNKVEVILNGYKRIESQIDFDEISDEKLLQYYDISKWIYLDGSIDDKVGIARNVVSISINNEELIEIENSLYTSILSAYSIYLKENVERYLEVKEKINDVLFDLSIKVTESANDIGKDLRTNIIGMITFFITIVLTNSMSNGNLKKIFTDDVTKLSALFVIGSVLYMIFSIVDSLIHKGRIKDQLNRIKLSYSDVLETKDIDNIFKKYNFKKDSKYMNKKIIFYIITWVIFILLMLTGIKILSGYNFREIIKLLIK